MLEEINKEIIVNRLLNVKAKEWPRIMLAWMIRFLYNFVFVISWTVMMTVFIGHFGIDSLPYLFVLNAFFVVLGTLFYSLLLDNVSKRLLMSITLAFAGIAMLGSLYFSSSNEILFFSFLLVALAVFLSQLRIQLIGFVEDIFNPLESERAFPLIETTETVAGISAGLVISIFAESVELGFFVKIVLVLMTFIFPLLIWSKHVAGKIPQLDFNRKLRKKNSNIVNKFKRALKSKNDLGFVKSLFGIVFLNWIIFNLVEFQYTSAVYSNISKPILEAGSGFEHIFIHDLGLLFVIFSSAAFLVQLLLASRILNSLGVVGTMVLHPLVGFLSFVGMAIFPGFWMAILMKTNFRITSVINHDAYHSSFYVLSHEFREYVHEVAEGFVRPMGAIIGTMLLLFLSWILPDQFLMLSVSIALICVGAMASVITYMAQSRYTETALNNLLKSKDYKTRADAVQVLAQKGHEVSIPALLNVIDDNNEALSLRVKVLEALGRMADVSVLDDLLKFLNSPERILRLKALEALGQYEFLGKSIKKYLFVEGLIVNALKLRYSKEENLDVRFSIINLMAKLSPLVVSDFIVNILNKEEGDLKAEAIIALGSFDDVWSKNYLEKFLTNKNPKYSIAAVISLSKINYDQDILESVIEKYLNSKNDSKIKNAIFAVGELRLKKFSEICFRYLDSDNNELVMFAVEALLKLNDLSVVENVIDLLFSADDVTSKVVQELLEKIDNRTTRKVKKRVLKLASQRIGNLLEGASSLKELDESHLIDLKRMYVLAEAYEEVDNVSQVINS